MWVAQKGNRKRRKKMGSYQLNKPLFETKELAEKNKIVFAKELM